MDAIDFSVNPPVFKSNCELCDLCWMLCPEGAIEIVNKENLRNALAETREKHPYVNFLNEQAEKGKFRWLVTLDEIGWDNPIYAIERYPRFDINELLNE